MRTKAGERVNELWLKATRETVEAAWAEAVRLRPLLDETELDYLEGLASVFEYYTGRMPDAPSA